jgi:oxygen-independent coproporphyrinogen-3 oxidase
LQYWHNDPYLGLGAGAHGYVRGDLAGFQNRQGLNGESKSCRYSNVMSPTAYIKRMEQKQLSLQATLRFRSGQASGISTPDQEIPRGYAARNDNIPSSPPFSPALSESILIDRKTEMDETMLTGMRLTGEGVTKERFRERFGVALEDVYAKELKELKARKLIEIDEERVRLTQGGRLVANWVFEKFV